MKKYINILFCLLFSISLLTAETISFSANNMSGQAGNSSSTTRLEGNAFIQTESMEINADLVELTGKDYKIIKAQGHIQGKNIQSKMDFTCDQLEYDRDTKIATLKGNVSLDDTENNVKAKAQIIEYNQDTDIAVLQIQINLTQKDNVCTGAYAVYNKNEQLLEISGNAQVKQGKDTFRAQQITLNMETQDITLEGNVKGSVTTEGGSKENSTGEEQIKDNPEAVENGEAGEAVSSEQEPAEKTENEPVEEKKDNVTDKKEITEQQNEANTIDSGNAMSKEGLKGFGKRGDKNAR